MAGCTLASAIAANLCRGMPLRAACEAATDYVHGALRHATCPGRTRVAMLDHLWRLKAYTKAALDNLSVATLVKLRCDLING